MCAPRLLLLLVAVEEAGDEEEHGEHKGEFGVRLGMDMHLFHAVQEPDRASDKPYPSRLLHSSMVGHWMGCVSFVVAQYNDKGIDNDGDSGYARMTSKNSSSGALH